MSVFFLWIETKNYVLFIETKTTWGEQKLSALLLFYMLGCKCGYFWTYPRSFRFVKIALFFSNIKITTSSKLQG